MIVDLIIFSYKYHHWVISVWDYYSYKDNFKGRNKIVNNEAILYILEPATLPESQIFQCNPWALRNFVISINLSTSGS